MAVQALSQGFYGNLNSLLMELCILPGVVPALPTGLQADLQKLKIPLAKKLPVS